MEDDIRKMLMTQLKIPEEYKTFLEGITIPVAREWSYICMTEGMGLERIKQICATVEGDSTHAGAVFAEEREKYLRERYENNQGLKDQYAELLRRVEIMYERTSALEEGLSGRLKEAMQEKDRAFAQTIQTKDLVIRDREKQLSDLKKEIADQKKENRELLQKYEGERERAYSLENRLKTAEIRLSSFAKSDDTDPGKDRKGTSSGGPGPGAGSGNGDDKVRVFPYSRYGYPVKRYRGRHSIFNRGDREADEFIRLYIENREYSEDQKQFLIECLEQGDPLHVIKKFASPNLSVNHMDQMRRIIYERGY